MADRDLDVVVFGATGDSGAVATACLYFRAKQLGVAKWAPAARNLGKLKADVLDKLAASSPGPHGLAPEPPLQADSGDLESLRRMCSRTRCVVACAGPYAEYGEGVLRACVECGTHYVDITAEIPWVETMLGKYGDEAAKNGVSIVNMGGYDSVPPDLSTFLAAQRMRADGETLGRFEAFIGGDSGLPTGTVNTMVAGINQVKGRVLRAVTLGACGTPPAPAPEPRAPYAPKSESSTMQRNLMWSLVPGFSSMGRQVCAPHFMAPFNVHVVHRTAAAEGYPGLQYRERLKMPCGPASLFGLLPTAGFMGGMFDFLSMLSLPGVQGFTLRQLEGAMAPWRRKVRAAAFAGYSATGSTVLKGYGVSKSGRTRVQVDFSVDHDCGVGFTALSACTIAGALVQRARAGGPMKAGFNTAVCAVGGDELAKRLQEAGVQIEVAVVAQ